MLSRCVFHMPLPLQRLTLLGLQVHEQNYRKEATLEVSRDRKSMSVLVNNVSVRDPSGRDNHSVTKLMSPLQTNKTSFLVKGAPENVLARSTHVFLSSTQQVVPLTDGLRA